MMTVLLMATISILPLKGAHGKHTWRLVGVERGIGVLLDKILLLKRKWKGNMMISYCCWKKSESEIMILPLKGAHGKHTWRLVPSFLIPFLHFMHWDFATLGRNVNIWWSMTMIITTTTRPIESGTGRAKWWIVIKFTRNSIRPCLSATVWGEEHMPSKKLALNFQGISSYFWFCSTRHC